MSFAWQAPLVFLAAFGAGMINSVAGGGTLVTFPTLVWLGRDPILANVTNAVALWPGSLSAMYGYRRELGDSNRWLRLLTAPSIAGAVLGAFLLLRTPSHAFAAIVPSLILFATLLFAVQEWLTRTFGAEQAKYHAHPHWRLGAAGFQFCVAVYGGYFGAGIGILMLATLGLLGLTDIHQMNGLKNFFAMCINMIAALYFIAWGTVSWSDAVVMALGAIAGGYGGAGLARRLGRRFVRRTVVAIGLTMAVSLYFRS